ncbi:MAG: hypothetical protein Q9198_005943 [Flavoplaca austrocitrina]
MNRLPYIDVEHDPYSSDEREVDAKYEYKVANELAEEGIASFVREVRFIHKSAADFLKNQKIIFEDSNWQCTGQSSAVREQIAIVGLAPMLIKKPKSYDLEEYFHQLLLSKGFVSKVMEAFPAVAGCCQVIRGCSIQMVDEFYDVLRYWKSGIGRLISYAPTRLKKTDESDDQPLEERLGFAAYYGRHDYVTQYLSSYESSPGDIDRLVSYTISGWARQARGNGYHQQKSTSTQKGLLRVLLDYLPLSTDPYIMVPHDSSTKVDRKSKWATFITVSFLLLDEEMMNPQHHLEIVKLWSDVVKIFFSHDASVDPNIVMLFNPKYIIDEYWFAESLLSYLEHFTTTGCKDPVAKIPMMEVENLVRSHGGTVFRRACSSYDDELTREIVLTDEQSFSFIRNGSSMYLSSSKFWYRRGEKTESPTQSDHERAADLVPRVEDFRVILE